MASRTNAVAPTLTLMFSVCIAIAATACEVTNPVAPGSPSVHPSATYGSDQSTDAADCPPDVAPADCQPLSQTERQTLWWDVQQGIKWWDENCAAIGTKIQDQITTGDMRKFPSASAWYGYWREQANSGSQVSIRSDRLGWYDTRLNTMLHEGVHVRWYNNYFAHTYALGGTFWAENNCVNW